jgi:Ulp1 family protease
LYEAIAYIIFPVHINMSHWVVGVIDLLANNVIVFDSYNNSNENICKKILEAIPLIFPNEVKSEWGMNTLH